MENKKINEAKKLENKNLFWEAGLAYQVALIELNRKKGDELKKRLCKNKIREMNIKRSQSFNYTTFNYKFTKEEKREIGKFIALISIGDISTILNKIGEYPNFYPFFQKIKKRSEESMPISMRISNLETQNNNGDLLKEGHNPDNVWFNQNYLFSQDFILHFYLTPLFHRIMKKKLNFENLSNYFKSKELFSREFIKILDVSFERFFNGDYVSTLHILVPQFEKIFLDITKIIEKDIITSVSKSQKGDSKKIWTLEKTLGEDFLRQENIRKIWGEDFCEQIIFVLFSQLGLKLRHKIAHGNLKLEHFNFQNSVLIIYFFLVIASRVKKAKKILDEPE